MESVRTIVQSNKQIRVIERRLVGDPDRPRLRAVEPAPDTPRAWKRETIACSSTAIAESNAASESITMSDERAEAGHRPYSRKPPLPGRRMLTAAVFRT